MEQTISLKILGPGLTVSRSTPGLKTLAKTCCCVEEMAYLHQRDNLAHGLLLPCGVGKLEALAIDRDDERRLDLHAHAERHLLELILDQQRDRWHHQQRCCRVVAIVVPCTQDKKLSRLVCLNGEKNLPCGTSDGESRKCDSNR